MRLPLLFAACAAAAHAMPLGDPEEGKGSWDREMTEETTWWGHHDSEPTESSAEVADRDDAWYYGTLDDFYSYDKDSAVLPAPGRTRSFVCLERNIEEPKPFVFTASKM